MPQNKITLLNECVAQADSYKHGTHQKIADTLHNIIESDNEAITIGLEGEWGTGKSTVVNLLEKNFKNKKK
ncbi:P-loop NTPase fold protein [Aeromonas media]|uniref:P-loop NTPase fold protein n=1 Tax=Aeromonas media TaxID=651 RepID=UPI003CFC9607